MDLFRIIFLLINLLTVLGSCAGPRECSRAGEENSIEIHPIIFLRQDSPVLYKANFEIYKYSFSGLIAFRKVSGGDEVRIAFLSEVGLKLMEFSYQNNTIRNTFCSPAIKRKSVPRFMSSMLELILHNPDCKSVCFYTEADKSNYFCKASGEKVIVVSDSHYRKQMDIKTGWKKQVNSVYNESDELPDQITIRMKYKSTIVFKHVVNAFR